MKLRWDDRISWFTRKTKSSKNTFIFPSIIGLALIAIALFSLVSGMIYANNLVLILGLLIFILVGFSSIITNFHLDAFPQIEIKFHDFHEDQIPIISLVNQEDVVFESLTIKCFFEKTRMSFIPTQRNFQNHLIFKSEHELPRGEYNIQFIEISTSYPLGLFKAWRIFRPNESIYVYPKKLIEHQFKYANFKIDNQNFITSGVDEYRGHDKGTPHQITNRTDWKKFFSHNQVWNKRFKSNQINKYEINLNSLASSQIDIEKELQIICGEIYQLKQQNIEWKLISKHQTIDSNLKDSLKELAKW